MSVGSSYTPYRPACGTAASVLVGIPLPWEYQTVAGTPQLTVAAWKTEVVDEVTVPMAGTFTVLAYGTGWYFDYLLELCRLNIINPWGDGVAWACVLMRATPVEQLYDLTEQANLNPESLQLTLDRLAQQGQDGTPYLAGEALTLLAHDESDTGNKLSRRPVVLATKDYTDRIVKEERDERILNDNLEIAERIEHDNLEITLREAADTAEQVERKRVDDWEEEERKRADIDERDDRIDADEDEAKTRKDNDDAEAKTRGDFDTNERAERIAADSAHALDYDNPHHVTAAQAGAESLAAAAVENLARLTAESLIAADLAAHVNNHSIHLTPGGGIPDGTALPLITFALPTDADGDTLWPEVTLSDNAAFTGGVTVVYDGRPVAAGGGAFTANMEVFDGTAWVAYPATGAGIGYHGKRVAFTAPGLAPVAGQTYYGRVRVWDGIAWSDYAGFSDMFVYGLPTGGGDVTLAQMNAAIELAKAQALAAAIAADGDGGGVDSAVAAHNIAVAAHEDIRDAVTAAAALADNASDTADAAHEAADAAAVAAGAATAAAVVTSRSDLAEHAAGTRSAHEQYLLAATYSAASKVTSVAGRSGAVTLTPADAGAEPALGNATAGQVLLSAGTSARAWGAIPVMTGAGADAASTVGAVPQAAAGMQNAVLTGGATWVKRRHYFVFRLLAMNDNVATGDYAMIRIPVAGNIVQFGVFVDYTGTISVSKHVRRVFNLFKGGVLDSSLGNLVMYDAKYAVSGTLAVPVAGYANEWQCKAVYVAGSENLGIVKGLSVWFIVEEA